MAEISELATQVLYTFDTEVFPLEVFATDAAGDEVGKIVQFGKREVVRDEDGKLEGVEFEDGVYDSQDDWVSVTKVSLDRDSAYIHASASTDLSKQILSRVVTAALRGKKSWSHYVGEDGRADVDYGTSCFWHAPFEFAQLLAPRLRLTLEDDLKSAYVTEDHEVLVHPSAIVINVIRLPSSPSRRIAGSESYRFTLTVRDARQYENCNFNVFSELDSDAHCALLDAIVKRGEKEQES